MECKDNCEHRGCQLQDPDHDGETLYGTGRRVRVHDDEDGCIGTSHEWQSRMMGKKKKKNFSTRVMVFPVFIGRSKWRVTP